MSLDPASPPTSNLPPANAAPSPGMPLDQDLPRMKRRFKKESGQDEEHPERAVQLLSTLLVDLIYGKSKEAPPEDAKVGKYHRLTRSGVAQDSGLPTPTSVLATAPAPAGSTGTAESSAPTIAASEGSAGLTDSAAVSTSPAAAAPGALTTSASVKFRPAPLLQSPGHRRGEQRVRQFWLLLLLLALGGAAYYVYQIAPKAIASMQSQTRAVEATPPPAPAWTDESLAQLDQSLAAAAGGDLDAAQQQAEELAKSDNSMPPGLDIYLALLRARAGHVNDAEAGLLKLIDTGTAALPPARSAQVREGLAFVFSRKRDFPSASQAFRNAAKEDPFSPTVYYHWGDLLRHQGKFQEAKVKFQEVLDRIPLGEPEMESLRQCTELKMRLTQIEEGKDGAVETEVQSHLAQPPVSGYWTLTAAAVALQRKDIRRATDFLQQSRATLGQTQFDALMNDYFFRGFADQKELAEFYPSDPKARRIQLRSTSAYMIEP